MSHNQFTTGANVYRDVVGARPIRCGDGTCKARLGKLRCILAEVHVHIGTSHLYRDPDGTIRAWKEQAAQEATE